MSWTSGSVKTSTGWLVGCLVVMAVGCGGAPNTTTAPAPTPPTMSIEDANAILARCPTPTEVAASDRDLVLSFENDPTAGQTLCTAAQSSRNLTLLQAQVYRVLIVARRLTFDSPLPWTSDSLYGWLIASIRGIRFRDVPPNIAGGFSFCCDPPGIINVTTSGNLAAVQFPTDFRWVGTMLVLFVHEARHNNGLPHTCRVIPANDNTIAELGAWGVQYYLDLFLGSHSDAAFITGAARAAFVQDAQNVCRARFCQDSCPGVAP